MSAPDFVTVLTSEGPLLTKRAVRGHDGRPVLRDYDHAKHFDIDVKEVFALADLASVLAGLGPRSCIVQGRPINGAPTHHARRLLHADPPSGDGAVLEPASHFWLPIDLDAIDCPAGLDPIADPDRAIDHVAGTVLPPEMRDRDVYWQLTSGAGFKPGIRLRLVYWCDRTMTGKEMKRWLADCHGVDCSIFAPNQPIYCARPIFDPGIPDPVPRRSGIRLGTHRLVSPPVEIPEPRRVCSGTVNNGAASIGYESWCRRIGDHAEGEGFFEPIKSTVASWIASNGAGADAAWLRADLENVIREAPRDPDAHPDGYIEKRVRDLNTLIPRVVVMQAAEEAETPHRISPGAPYDTAKLLIHARFTGADGRSILHHHRRGFYVWNGAAYPEIDDAEIRSQVYAFLSECVVRVNDERGQSPVKPNTSMVNNVLDALRAAAHLPATVQAPAWLEQVPDLAPDEIVACSNGLLHLPTLELLPHTPLYFTHNALDYAFERNAPVPRGWLAFLRQLLPEDTEAIDTLQEIFGYLLVADTSQQKAFMIVGPKRSGKGTIARVLARLVGADNRVAPTLAGLGTNFGLAPLIGKRVAIVSDARLGGRADQAAIAERILSITGEDAITVDRKYREAWTGRLGVRFLVLTNELPRLNDASGALVSRFILLVLNETFYGREDPGLTDKLLPELPGILNWAIAGWQRLNERGYFVQPESSRDSMSALEDLGSPIGAFLRDACEVGGGGTVAVDEIFEAWEEWCADQGQKAGTKAVFGKELRAALPGLRMRFPHEGSERVRVYVGLQLKQQQPTPPQDACVKWYDPMRGFGFVTLADGADAMLPTRAVRESGADTLADQQKVKVIITESARGRRVVKMEICGIM